MNDEGVVEAGIGRGVVEGAGVTGFRVGGREDQAREAGGVGGTGTHGAWFEGGVESAAGQAPATKGGGGATNCQQFGVCRGVPGSLALVGGDGQDLPSPGDHGPDRDFPFIGGIPSGEQGAAHHHEVGFGKLPCCLLCHKFDDNSTLPRVVAGTSTPSQ